jgi:ABC-type phosphate/phosphonate transport system substrate-binding protein
MSRSIQFALFGALAAASLLSTGCESASLRMLSLVGMERRPLAVALVVDRPEDAAQALNPFADYKPLQHALGRQLARPVAVDACFSFQVEPAFANGWYDLAVLTPTQFARLSSPAASRVVAVSVDRQGRVRRSALLIVRADSPLHTPDELKGLVVGFGPRENALTHYAALRYLESEGVAETSLAHDLLPLPGNLRHFAQGATLAQAVIERSVAAGFIDEADWEALPETSAVEFPARDRLRVLGRTAPLPHRLLLASPRLDAGTLHAVEDFVFTVGRLHPDALRNLPVSGYRAATPDTVAACLDLHPGSEPAAAAPVLTATPPDPR